MGLLSVRTGHVDLQARWQPAFRHASCLGHHAAARCTMAPSSGGRCRGPCNGWQERAAGRRWNLLAYSGGEQPRGPVEPFSSSSSSSSSAATTQQPAGLGAAAALLLAWYGCCLVAVKALQSWAQRTIFPSELASAVVLLGGSAAQLGLAAACFVLASRSRPQGTCNRELFVWPGWQVLGRLLLDGFCACLLTAQIAGLLLSQFCPQQADMAAGYFVKQMLAAGWAVRSMLLVVAAVVGPAAEELMFRGLLLPSLAGRLPFWAAMAVSSLVFSAAHFSLAPARLLTNLVFDAMYLRTRSLWPSFFMHGLWNAFGIAAAAAASMYKPL